MKLLNNLIFSFLVLIRTHSASLIDLGIVSEHVESSSIIEYQDYINHTLKKNFQNKVLAYTTPWNYKGNDISQTFGEKIDYVSPVWYRILSNAEFFQLDGKQDVNDSWIDSIRSINYTKIVPRFECHGWDQDVYMRLFNQPLYQSSLAELLVYECNDKVFEGGLNLYFQDFFKVLSKRLKETNKILIITIKPSSPTNNQPNIPSYQINQILKLVDYVSLMTYDYSFPGNPGPNSPIEWVKESVKLLDPDYKYRNKILMGLNFYGNDYFGKSGVSVINKDYLSILESYSVQFEWNDENKEHLMRYQVGKDKHVVYYPTLKFYKSITERLEAALDLGVGISIWEIGQGLDYFYDLL